MLVKPLSDPNMLTGSDSLKRRTMHIVDWHARPVKFVEALVSMDSLRIFQA